VGTIGSSLASAFDFTVDRLCTRLEGLSDEEYFWEPVSGCWSLREGPDGRWLLDGGAPDGAAPITTIAWRIGHAGGLALGGFADQLFADGTLTPDAIAFPRHAADVERFVRSNYASWRDGMVEIGDAGFEELLGPAWGPYAASNHLDLALHVLDEVVHHGAEIGLLRDLYARRS
jgi:hypothetical protein